MVWSARHWSRFLEGLTTANELRMGVFLYFPHQMASCTVSLQEVYLKKCRFEGLVILRYGTSLRQLSHHCTDIDLCTHGYEKIYAVFTSQDWIYWYQLALGVNRAYVSKHQCYFYFYGCICIYEWLAHFSEAWFQWGRLHKFDLVY